MNKRNTLQKNIVLNSIKSTKLHPTAKTLYEMIKKDNPTIGQATVYRNLNDLVNTGKVKLIPNVNSNHFDGDISNHNHFICNRCGNIIDIFDDNNTIDKKLEKKYMFDIYDISVIYNGICKDCKK